jgi:hypothetical protein
MKMTKSRVTHMTRDPEKPFDRSYWVAPKTLLAGCYPGSEYPDESAQRLKGLLNCGIRFVVNLMQAHETNYYGDGFVPYEKPLIVMGNELGIEVQCVRFPIPDMSIPSEKQMIKILDTIDETIERDTPVYVHCWGGVGRTGTVVGCYLARHGVVAGQECLARIRELRYSDPITYRSSPETDQQIDMVMSWRP